MSFSRLRGNENVIHNHNGILFTNKEKWNHGIYRYMDRIRIDYIKWGNSGPERQILYILSHTGFLLQVFIEFRTRNNPSQETTAEHNEEINGSWGAQDQ